MTALQKQRPVLIAATVAIFGILYYRCSTRSSSEKRPVSTRSRRKVQVDMVFFRRLIGLLKVCIPSPFSKETLTFATLAALLMMRTRLTIMMSQVVGQNAKCLVNRNGRQFVASVLDIGLWSLPSAVVNTGIKYMTSQLEDLFRRNLQAHMHDRYLSKSALYRAAHTNDLDHPDHRLTQDLLAFSHETSEIFPQLFKPSVDCVIFILALSKHGGVLPPLSMVGYYLLAGGLLKSLMPNFAKLTAMSAHKEGDLRKVHSQIIQHAEEVAFYRGERTERANADKCIKSVTAHQLHVKQLKSYTDVLDGLLIKYGATCVGYAVCSVGVFAAKATASVAERTRIYIQSSQLLIPLAQATGKLVLLYNRITALAGHTARVSELKEFLDDCDAKASIAAKTPTKDDASDSEGQLSIQEVPDSDQIQLAGVTIPTPDGITLLRDLTVTVQRNRHLMIMGNNGSGKSALLRAIMSVWAIDAGRITRPLASDICFVPQRTYLPKGSLRTQLVFPHTEEELKQKNVSDDELMKLVATVGLTSVVTREGGLDSYKEWHEVLSGGERQRFAFVRLLYHRPKFGILDEATSAVSQDIEPGMYEGALARGITLITASHREALKKYHHQLLVLDGSGGYTLETLPNEFFDFA